MNYCLEKLLKITNPEDDSFYRVAITNDVELLMKHFSQNGMKIITEVGEDPFSFLKEILIRNTDGIVYYRQYAIDIETIVNSLKDSNTTKSLNDDNIKKETTIAFINLIRNLNDLKLKDIRIIFVHQIHCYTDISLPSSGLRGYSLLSREEKLICCPSTYLYSCPIVLRYDYSVVIDKESYKPIGNVTINVIKHRDFPFGMQFNIPITDL